MAARRLRAPTIVTILGIPVRVHPTFLILVGLAALGFFGPPLGGVAWVLALFACVVAHELAHSVVANHRGIGVRDIVLLPIGGVSEMERLPDRPRDELAVAIAGPVTSLTLAALFAAMAVATGDDLGAFDLAEGSFLSRLALGNAVLAAFNAIPAFPMDGGRVLRAALATRLGLERATRIAGTTGRALAALMAGFGILYSPWLLMIAFFVFIGGVTEEAATLVHVRLGRLTVREVMAAPPAAVDARLVPVAVPEDETVEDAVTTMNETGASAAAVVDRTGGVVGLLLIDDVKHLLTDPQLRPEEDRHARQRG